jgi:hypothetical protein
VLPPQRHGEGRFAREEGPPVIVHVRPDRRGHWEVSCPDRRPVLRDSLDEARQLAARWVDQVGATELLVRDAYERVLVREQLGR